MDYFLELDLMLICCAAVFVLFLLEFLCKYADLMQTQFCFRKPRQGLRIWFEKFGVLGIIVLIAFFLKILNIAEYFPFHQVMNFFFILYLAFDQDFHLSFIYYVLHFISLHSIMEPFKQPFCSTRGVIVILVILFNLDNDCYYLNFNQFY